SHGYDDIPVIKKMIQYPTHFSAIKKDKRFTLVAASDVSAKQRQLFQKKVPPHVKLYANYRAMLKYEAIDLLVIAVPTELHYKVCSYALQIGIKNILCEKPITRSVAEAKKLIALAKPHKARILVNYQRSYSQNYAQLAKLIRAKNWGRVRSVSVRYNNGIFNIATHLINLLEHIFGPIKKVQSVQSDTRGAKDPNISFTAFTKGPRIFFEGVDGVDYRLLEIDMKFEKGRVVLDYDAMSEFRPRVKEGYSFLRKSSQRPFNVGMLDVYENVFQVLACNKKPACDIHWATQTLKAAEKAMQSAKTGKLMSI
ncbi:MAG: Gfo/Idh/MocA family oxidoreductase, partial [Patescibacteria group bacterium]